MEEQAYTVSISISDFTLNAPEGKDDKHARRLGDAINAAIEEMLEGYDYTAPGVLSVKVGHSTYEIFGTREAMAAVLPKYQA